MIVCPSCEHSNPDGFKVCSKCGHHLGRGRVWDIAGRSPEIVSLERRLADLEKRVPNTGLFSPRFINRAIAIWWHVFVVQLVISLVISAIWVGFVVFALLSPALRRFITGASSCSNTNHSFIHREPARQPVTNKKKNRDMGSKGNLAICPSLSYIFSLCAPSK